LIFKYTKGQTPLDETEKDGLLIRPITTQQELDEHEQLNIEFAIEWILRTKLNPKKILTEDFVKALHKRMYGKVWAWAGKFRRSEKNIGVAWPTIPIELKTLLDDTRFWVENNTYSADETAIRFKYHLVSIHCFANGNGRHSRIMADIIIESIFGSEIFPWNDSNMVAADETRKKYITALQAGDKGDISSLIDFARK